MKCQKNLQNTMSTTGFPKTLKTTMTVVSQIPRKPIELTFTPDSLRRVMHEAMIKRTVAVAHD